MSSKIILGLSGLLLLLTPSMSVAYITPEQAVHDEWLWIPPSTTEARNRVHMQQERSAERREREQEAYFAEQHPPVPEEQDIEPYFNDPAWGPKDPYSYIDEDELRRTARLLDRVDRQQAQIYDNYALGTLHHRRAPVAGTGPESIVAGMVLLGVGYWTVRRAWRKTV
ncbi:hypothetical protein COU77_00370 [Candidatus Peregrinibacteria bacterium CG10_big_fil_rev_8_21_14_0_10_49_16]|nr:MAG: hypothetical protein COW95_04345 [Candidatus Peregrinibacteria bacterium CG22_combo_CG10-13_8_21_14_all_49_11]PIR52440.1 MAG: hypothetical protein COU77_00370 [Candidatus Peregrinibacteria bacterium CG10_big_fil_rev_8_21_14_0_10_49_16]